PAPRRLRRLPRRLGRRGRGSHRGSPRRSRGRGRDGHAGQGARARELPVDARARGLAPPADGTPRVIVVSHRGPATFVRAEDGSFRARRGSGGLAGTLGRLLSGGTDESVGWVAAGMADGDRAAGAGRPTA